jgi:hypothetical protein
LLTEVPYFQMTYLVEDNKIQCCCIPSWQNSISQNSHNHLKQNYNSKTLFYTYTACQSNAINIHSLTHGQITMKHWTATSMVSKSSWCMPSESISSCYIRKIQTTGSETCLQYCSHVYLSLNFRFRLTCTRIRVLWLVD